VKFQKGRAKTGGRKKGTPISRCKIGVVSRSIAITVIFLGVASGTNGLAKFRRGHGRCATLSGRYDSISRS